MWGGFATFALLVAVLSALFSHSGSPRAAAPIEQGAASQVPASQLSLNPASAGHATSGQSISAQGSAQPRAAAAEAGPRAEETAEEIRRLAEAVRALAADRDRVLVRLAAIERNLEGITGSIRRDRPAGAPPTAPQAPSAAAPQIPSPSPAAQLPPFAPSAVAAPRAEPTAALMIEAALPPVAAPTGPGDAAAAVGPDAGKAAASPSNPTTGPSLSASPSPSPSPSPMSTPADPLVAASGLGVDIGGALNYDGLRTLWRSTKNGEPLLPDELYPLVAVRENGKTHGPELRLVVGPIADAEAAARLCTSLAAAHHYCQPVAFEGQRLSKIDPPAGKAVAPHPVQPPRIPSILK
jgi:hypothetical protein